MKCVEIKYPGNSKTYWFGVPRALERYVTQTDRVLCGSDEKNSWGVVVNVYRAATPSDITELTGGRELKMIRGIEYEASISEFSIPRSVRNSRPSVEKLANRIKEYYRGGKFNTNVVFTIDSWGKMTLTDGFTAFLVARMFGEPELCGILCAGQE